MRPFEESLARSGLPRPMQSCHDKNHTMQQPLVGVPHANTHSTRALNMPTAVYFNMPTSSQAAFASASRLRHQQPVARIGPTARAKRLPQDNGLSSQPMSARKSNAVSIKRTSSYPTWSWRNFWPRSMKFYDCPLHSCFLQDRLEINCLRKIGKQLFT
jgi:hypothetical protein